MRAHALRGRALAAAAGLLGLAACTEVGPNYKLPETSAFRAPTAQGGFLGANSPAVSQAPVPDGWWRLYDDPVLDGLERQALAANTDLRVAMANLARAEAVQEEARSANEPIFGALASPARAKVSGEQYLMTESIPPANIGDVGLRASYQIDLFGRLKRAAEAAGADAEASRAGLDLARVSVAGDVAGAYVDACSANEELAVANHTTELQARSLAITERLVSAGRDSGVDLTRARGVLAQARSAAPALVAKRQAALFRLAALTGRPPAEFPAVVSRCTAVPRLKTPIPVGDGAGLLRRRPDVRQAERRLAAATARIGVATAALYPTITIGADVGSTGFLSDLGQPAANRWSFGPMIAWTFPSGGERARIRQANAASDAALAQFDGVVLDALRETETSLSAYARDLDRNAELRVARDEAAQAQVEAERLYSAGRSPYIVGLDAQRTLAQAEASLAISDGQVAADQVRLFLSLGGGWGAGVSSRPVSGIHDVGVAVVGNDHGAAGGHDDGGLVGGAASGDEKRTK